MNPEDARRNYTAQEVYDEISSAQDRGLYNDPDNNLWNMPEDITYGEMARQVADARNQGLVSFYDPRQIAHDIEVGRRVKESHAWLDSLSPQERADHFNHVKAMFQAAKQEAGNMKKGELNIPRGDLLDHPELWPFASDEDVKSTLSAVAPYARSFLQEQEQREQRGSAGQRLVRWLGGVASTMGWGKKTPASEQSSQGQQNDYTPPSPAPAPFTPGSQPYSSSAMPARQEPRTFTPEITEFWEKRGMNPYMVQPLFSPGYPRPPRLAQPPQDHRSS